MADPKEEPLGKDRTHEVAMLQFGIRSAIAALLDLQEQNDPAVRTNEVREQVFSAMISFTKFLDNQGPIEKRRVRVLRAV